MNFPFKERFIGATNEKFIVVSMLWSQVILYGGEPLSHYAEMTYLNTCAKSYSILFNLNDPVLQFFL